MGTESGKRAAPMSARYFGFPSKLRPQFRHLPTTTITPDEWLADPDWIGYAVQPGDPVFFPLQICGDGLGVV